MSTEIQTQENELTINGVVIVPADVDVDKFTDELLAWMESKGYKFGGGVAPFTDIPN